MHTLQVLEKKLGYTFRCKEQLQAALYHSSYANEHRCCGVSSNERLEFLGDAVLGLVTADYLYHKHPDLPEGDLTRMRAALVCEESLYEVAQSLGLGNELRLGKGEEAGGGRCRPSILADATESVFAAVYLDGGMEAARALIHRVLLDKEQEEAVEERKWAFAADYIRLYALHTDGGIYLDSDVEVFRPFDKLLGYEFFTGTEYSPIDYKYADVPIDAQGIPLDRDAFVPGYGIQAAIMGAAKGSGFVRECMDYYEGRHFREADGRLRTDLTMPLVIAKIAERHGFRYLDKEQVLGGGRLYIGRNSLLPSSIHLLRLGTAAFHHCAGSWLDPDCRLKRQMIGGQRIRLALKYAFKAYRWRRRKKRAARKRLKQQNNRT